MEKRTFITTAELKALWAKRNNFMLIDVRNHDEFESCHLPLAMNVPLDQIQRDVLEPPTNKLVVTICNKGGGRSEKAANYLRSKFNSNAVYLEGGVKAWYDLD